LASLADVPGRQQVTLDPGDVVAVRLPPGPEWLEVVTETWEAAATLFPVDHRVPEAMAADLVRRARPTAVRDAAGTKRVDGDPAGEGDALILHTSGTTDGPKLVRLSRSAVEAAVESSSEAISATPRDGWLCCLPVAHVGGLLVVLRGVLLGAPVEVQSGFDPDAVATSAGATFTSLVPTMLRRLLDASVDLGRFHAILVGGSALSPDLRERAQRAGARVVETYGLTESCGGVVHDGLPFERTDVRIGRDGEIELRGPTLLSGYRSVDGEPPMSEEGWLRTRDAGELDDRGRLRVLGRLDDVIVTGGEKVSPDEVEGALVAHARVRDVAVAGRPDPVWGERVVAWVVPHDPSAPPTLDELREATAAVLPRHAAPRELTLVERLPRTFSGKVRRAALPRE
jgi:O-succinylbenzoic acid--CoA ligase